MYTVILGDETFILPESTFFQIRKLAIQHRVCQFCEKPFDAKENPMVAESICLSCFKDGNEHLNLQAIPVTTDAGETTYRFLDSDGYVYTSSPVSGSVEAYESIPLTLTHWGFPDTDTVELEGKLVELDSVDAAIYGDFQHNSVIVLSKRKKAGRLEVSFLCYRQGNIVYLDKAKGYTRKVWREAEAAYLQTKDSRGRYHYNGHVDRMPNLADEYSLLSDRESEKHDQGQDKA